MASSKVDLNGEIPFVFFNESSYGNILADSFKQCSLSDAAIIVSVVLNSSLKKGDIRIRDIFNSHRWVAGLYVLELNGGKVLEILNKLTEEYPKPSPLFPQVSGISFELTSKKDAKKISNVQINSQALILDKTYKIVMDAALPSVLVDERIIEKGVAKDTCNKKYMWQIFADYLKSQGETANFEDKRILID
ncbi:MAG: 5'-nucleotidase C-terminal domain-containing protein [Pseudomonadota bacterium]